MRQREADRIAAVRRRIEAGQPIEDVLRYLRGSGTDMSDSIWVLVKSGHMNPTDAKRAVLDSSTWSDMRGVVNSFHEALINEVTSHEKG